MVQLAERSILPPEILNSNPVIGNYYLFIEKTKIDKRGREWLIFRSGNHVVKVAPSMPFNIFSFFTHLLNHKLWLDQLCEQKSLPNFYLQVVHWSNSFDLQDVIKPDEIGMLLNLE